MDTQEIISILRGQKGLGLPERGVGPDDVLLGTLRDIPDEQKPDFWSAFGESVTALWNAKDEYTLQNAAAFISRFEELPAQYIGPHLNTLISDELFDLSGDNSTQLRQCVVAALQIISAVGLGDRIWWKKVFASWVRLAKSQRGVEGLLAWRALLSSYRGLIRHGQVSPNFDAWFDAARSAADFPAMELLYLLSEETKRQENNQELRDEVVSDFKSLYALCTNERECPQSIRDLKYILITWLTDRQGFSKADAEHLLAWQRPSKKTPWERLHSGAQVEAVRI